MNKKIELLPLLLYKYSFFIGLIGVVSSIYYQPTAELLLLTLVMYIMLMLGFTIGQHRLFSHGSYSVNNFWKTVVAYFATLSLFGSVIQFSGFHKLHHKHSDTEKDPHITSASYFIIKKFRYYELDVRTYVKLLKDPIYKFFHEKYLLIVVGTVLVLLSMSPFILIYGYLLPVFFVHFIISIHQVTAHYKDQPRSLPVLNMLLLGCGEFYHKEHHDKPMNPRFGKYDFGYFIINIIRSK